LYSDLIVSGEFVVIPFLENKRGACEGSWHDEGANYQNHRQPTNTNPERPRSN
jgi:hypothetical protein